MPRLLRSCKGMSRRQRQRSVPSQRLWWHKRRSGRVYSNRSDPGFVVLSNICWPNLPVPAKVCSQNVPGRYHYPATVFSAAYHIQMQTWMQNCHSFMPQEALCRAAALPTHRDVVTRRHGPPQHMHGLSIPASCTISAIWLTSAK